MLDDTEDIALNFGDESAGKQKRFKYEKNYLIITQRIIYSFKLYNNKKVQSTVELKKNTKLDCTRSFMFIQQSSAVK